MALGDEGEGKDHGDEQSSVNGRLLREKSKMQQYEEKTDHGAEDEGDAGNENDDGDDDGDDDEDEEEEDEPRLKYASLTKNLKPLYRNGDATSAFLVAGDKMVRINGYIWCQQAKC